MSWATIRAGMRLTIDNATTDLVVHDRMPSTLPEKNVAVVLPGEPLYAPSGHRGAVDVNIRVVVRCTRAEPEDAQAALDAYIWPTGANSIVAAVEALPNLGGTVEVCQFMRVQGYGQSGDAGANAGAFQADVIFKAVVQA